MKISSLKSESHIGLNGDVITKMTGIYSVEIDGKVLIVASLGSGSWEATESFEERMLPVFQVVTNEEIPQEVFSGHLASFVKSVIAGKEDEHECSRGFREIRHDKRYHKKLDEYKNNR